MAGKKTGKRLLTWVLVLVMALSLLPLNALATDGPETGGGSGMNFDKQLVSDEPDEYGNYTIQMTAQATGKKTTTDKAVPMDIVLVLDQSGSMADDFGNGTRQSAMKAAVNSFIDEVAKKHGPNADHRMAIVTFGTNAYPLEGWTAVDSDGATKLTGKISSLPEDPSGATNVGAGMELAQNLMGSAPTDENRQKTVIVFTDGVPTTASDFSTTVANTAIDAAKGMKAAGVTVYTVGIFNGADPDEMYGASGFDTNSNGTVNSKWAEDNWGLFPSTDFSKADRPAGNRFLNLVSSNYPNADSIGLKRETKGLGIIHSAISYKITKNFNRAAEGNYYLTASDASDLNDIFKTISDTVPEPDKAELNGDTVITDTLSDYFTFALTEDGKVDVKVYAEKGGNKREITDKVTVNPNSQTKTVTVTDYDFSKYHTESTNPETLVIEIKVKPSGDGCTSKEIPTNADTAEKHAAKVEVKSEDGTEPTFVTSHKTAKVTGHKVIYDLNGGTGSITDKDLYYPQDAVVAVTNSVPTLEGYEFTGWKSDIKDDDTVYTSNGTNSSITMPAANVILKAQWTANKYTVTYELDGGKINDQDSYTDNSPYEKDDTVTVAPNPTKEGYTFAGWTVTVDSETAAVPTITEGEFTMPAANVVLTAQWTANSGTKYTVKHYQQNLNDNDYTQFQTETDKTGTTGELTNATAKNYKGFTAKPFEQKTIAANGSTVVDIYYDRNTYSVTYTDGVNDETIFADEVHQSVKYGAPVPAYNNGTNPSRKNYTFAGWDPSVPVTMPADNLTFTAQWEKNIIPTYNFDLTDLGITVYKNFVSKYGRSAEKSFTATATIEKETYTAEVDPNSPSNRSAATAEPTYIGEAIGTVTLKTDTTKAFDFGKDSNGKDSKFQLEPGDYRITVEETKGTDRYVTYDNARYTYTFTVTNEGKIVNINTPITCTFTNMYTKRHTAATPSKPTLNTGDHYAYVMGYPDGTVRPNGSITRAEVSAILFRLLSDKTRDEYFTTESSFTDVKAGAWYNNSIATLEKAGVIVDTAKGGAFRPNEAITRAELAAMLAQFSDAKPVKGVKFSDVSAEHWAYEAIAIAAKMGWIEGYPDGTFRPDATITRAEMMTLVNRALERVPSDEDHLLSKRVMLTFPDCKSGDWFYIAVQEATNSHTYERAATEKNGDEQWTALRANRDWTLLEK